MLTYIAGKLTNSIMTDCENEQEYELCRYGCEIWLYTIVSTMGLLLIGAILGSILETIVIITIFYLCQSNGGGYHASSHVKCFMTMAIGLVLSLAVLYISFPPQLYYIFLCISSVFLFMNPLCLHENKQHLVNKAATLKIRSRIVCLSIVFFIWMCSLLGQDIIARSGCIALFTSALSRLYALVHPHRR